MSTNLLQSRLLVVLRGVSVQDIPDLMQALEDGGVRFAEFPFDASGKTPDSEIAALMHAAREWSEGRSMQIGAGTVIRKELVRLAKDAGASYLVSPNTDPEIIAFTKENNLFSMPGAMTVTEIIRAWNSGADAIKVFPASVLGPAFFHAVKEPLPHVPLFAFGGIRTEDIPAYRAAGTDGFGIASQIVPADAVASKDWARITACAKAVTGLLR